MVCVECTQLRVRSALLVLGTVRCDIEPHKLLVLDDTAPRVPTAAAVEQQQHNSEHFSCISMTHATVYKCSQLCKTCWRL
jgi:hypothetical protein